MNIWIEALLIALWWAGSLLLLYPRERGFAFRRAQWLNQLGFLVCTMSLWFGSLGVHVISSYLCLYLLQGSLIYRKLRA